MLKILSLAMAGVIGLYSSAWAGGSVTVAYAGSMGAVMDRGIGPAFAAASGTQFHGIGEAAMGIAHLIVAKTMVPDVFVSVSAAPARLVERAGFAGPAVPVASTAMVLAYSPKSRFAAAFASVKNGGWTRILANPALRFGRTDPAVDPQGQYVLYTLQLAQAYYKLPGFVARVAGEARNPAEIFAEPSLLARLQDGQIDATLSYKSAVISQHLPYINLPPQINLSTPGFKAAYRQASLSLTLHGVRRTLHPSPLVFYAQVLKNAPNPQAARAFLAFLSGPQGQKILAHYGYGPGVGNSL